ncbi:MAG: hypothetical protein IKO48_00805 [Elusimicrobia bacterium]|nr:hypothetical protein [Elusimicrobiota bacterium]
MVPKGGIIIWSGSVNDIPAGWVLCDGTNGTPDLRDRFVLGAGRNYTVDSTGGEATHTLTIDEMPRHNHTTQWRSFSGGGGSGYTDPVNPETGDLYIPTSYVGNSQPHNNMPPYYSLCYIMRK